MLGGAETLGEDLSLLFRSTEGYFNLKIAEKTKRKTFSSDGAASPCYPNTMGVVVAEALGEGRFGGGGVVVSDTLAHVLRASEPTAVALWRGTKRRRQYDPRHWSVKPFPLFAF